MGKVLLLPSCGQGTLVTPFQVQAGTLTIFCSKWPWWPGLRKSSAVADHRETYSTPRDWRGHRHAACYPKPGWGVLWHFTPTEALQEAPCAYTSANHRASMGGCCLLFPETQGSSGPPLPLLLSPPLGTQDSSVLPCPFWEKLSVMESKGRRQIHERLVKTNAKSGFPHSDPDPLTAHFPSSQRFPGGGGFGGSQTCAPRFSDLPRRPPPRWS